MGDAPRPEWAALVQGGDCYGAAAGKCSLVAGVLVVEGVTIEGSARFGLRIQEPHGPVEVRGLRASGHEVAMDVGPTCASCTVTVTDAELHPRSVGVQLGEHGAVEGAVTLSGLRVVAGEQEGTEVFGGATLAVYAPNLTGALRITGASLEAAKAVPGSRAIWNRGASIPLTLQDVEIVRYGRGIIGDFTAMTLRNVGIMECGFDAIYSTTHPDLEADGLRVDGCGTTIPECIGDQCGSAVLLYGPLGQAGDHVHLRNVTFTNNSYALGIFSYRELRLEGFRITDGDVGAGVLAVQDAIIGNGTVARQSQHGMDLGVGALAMRRVAFLDNGHAVVNATRGGLRLSGMDIRELDPTEPSTDGPWLIRESVFSGNVPVGLYFSQPPALDARAADTLLDARFNYWGSPAGPSPFAQDERPLPGFGDVVQLAGFVLTEPHLIAPPA
jgi:hypothetical protein